MSTYNEVEKVCQLLADSRRLEIINILLREEVCICEFVEHFNISQPAISKHIKKLKDAGMLLERKEAQWKYYKMNQEYQYYDLIQYIVALCPNTSIASKRNICIDKKEANAV